MPVAKIYNEVLSKNPLIITTVGTHIVVVCGLTVFDYGFITGAFYSKVIQEI